MRDRRRDAPRSMRRGGFTLIEMVIVFSMLGALMSFGIVLLGLLLRADTAGQNALEHQLIVSRLEQQFRTDAHNAAGATVSDDAQSLTMQLSDNRRVIWSIIDAGIKRQLLDGETIKAQETYPLSDGESRFRMDSSVSLVELQRRQVAAALTESPADVIAKPSREWRVQAGIGLSVVPPAPPAASGEEP